MSTYYINFENNTTSTWTMGVYMTIPKSVGLESVTWLQTTAPQSGSTGVSWEETYDVAITNYKQDGGIGVYKASQTINDVSLGTAWNIVYEDNVQQLQAAGSTSAGQILIQNQSGLLANPGIGMSGQTSVVKSNVYSGSHGEFEVTPTYYVALFNDVQLGTVISSAIITDPLTVQFPSGQNAATLTASVDGESLVLTLSYGSQQSVKVKQVEAVQKTKSVKL